MKCQYCDCNWESTHIINNTNLCKIHYKQLKDIKPSGRKLGHESYYRIETEREFDCVDEIELNRRRPEAFKDKGMI